MHIEDGSNEVTGARSDGSEAGVGRPRFSRRQALGRMSAVATAGAAAWIVPEIMVAKPAAAAMSGNGGGDPDNDGDHDGNGGPDPDRGRGPKSSTDSLATVTPSSLFSAPTHAPAMARDAGLGAVTVAGGWAAYRWASRRPDVATTPVQDAGPNIGDGDPAGVAGDGRPRVTSGPVGNRRLPRRGGTTR
jgi:hypothetical protein